MNPIVEKLATDADRLSVLRAYEILDTPAEKVFDDAVAVASALCNAPIALVSLVDEDRQWFKAKCGIDFDSTPLDQSVCAHAIRQDGLLVINDLTKDPRTSGNALVTGEAGSIRFYAGAPLITSQGVALGSLCVIDNLPRPGGLTDLQRKGLAALGRQVTEIIEMRRVLRASTDEIAEGNRRSETLQHQQVNTMSAQEAGRIGTFSVETETDEMTVSPRFCQIFGLPVRERYSALELEACILPEDQDKVSSHESRVRGDFAAESQYRIKRPNGEIRWVERRATFGLSDDGQHRQMFGTVEDITDRVADDERQAVMNRELHHRIKNSLAMVQALTQQTLRRVADRDAVDALNQRLFALGKAHDVLLQQDWEAGSLQDLVREGVSALGQSNSVTISGEDLLLGPRAAIATAMLIHELGANAIKHGALSEQDGRVSIDWHVDRESSPQLQLIMRWIEQGGPPTAPPTTKGFGSRLINLGINGTGGADVRYLESGLHAVFTADLDSAQRH